MSDSHTQTVITNLVRRHFSNNGIKIAKLILFGSQALGTQTRESDWDFLAIIDLELDWQRKVELRKSLRRSFAKMHLSVDIVIKTAEQFETESKNVGYISYYAQRDGILL